MGKASLILVLGTMTLFTLVSMSVNDRLLDSSKSSYTFYSNTHVRNIANSMVQLVLLEIANDYDYRVATEETKSLLGGSATYTVTTPTGDDSIYVKIDVTATYNGVNKKVIAYAVIPDGWVPPFMRASWTANADLNQTISDMFIDGRNYDLSGNIIPNTGRPGISSSVEFRNVDNAAIGGTGLNNIDYPMAYPEDPNAIEEFYNWGSIFPETPDEILGYPEGTLKAIAKSGKYGSQYILNPGKKINKKDAGLNAPVSGVTYIEITDGIEAELKFSGYGNSGIVVVHGPGRSSRLKGVKVDKHSDGVLTGILITDYSFHHHLDILGSVLQLSPNLELIKECKGNEDHWVHYSSEAIENATLITAQLSGLVGNNTNAYGFGSSRIKIARWYEW